MFTSALLSHIFNRWRYNSLLFSPWGKYFVTVVIEDPKKKKVIIALIYINNQDTIGCINSLTLVANPDHMSLLIYLTFKKSYSEYLK